MTSGLLRRRPGPWGRLAVELDSPRLLSRGLGTLLLSTVPGAPGPWAGARILVAGAPSDIRGAAGFGVQVCPHGQSPWPGCLRAVSLTAGVGGCVALLRGPPPGAPTPAQAPSQGGGHGEPLAQVRAETAEFCPASLVWESGLRGREWGGRPGRLSEVSFRQGVAEGAGCD